MYIILALFADVGAIPNRKANFTFKINITYLDAFNDLGSPQALQFIRTLEQEVDIFILLLKDEIIIDQSSFRVSHGSCHVCNFFFQMLFSNDNNLIYYRKRSINQLV